MATQMMMTPMTGMGTMGMPSMGMGMANMASTMVPRCTMKVEKCTGGMKMTCTCDDEVAATMLQNLCKAMAGGMCSVCCMMNGMVVCSCNMTMCNCKCEMIENGVCFTCTSDDKNCCTMVQACCDCLCSMMKCGCTCCVMINGMTVCCCC